LDYQENLEHKVRKAILGAKKGFEFTKRTAVPAHLIKNPPKKQFCDNNLISALFF